MAVTTICSSGLSLIKAFLHIGFLHLLLQSVDLVELTLLGKAGLPKLTHPPHTQSLWQERIICLAWPVHEPAPAAGHEVNPL